MKGKILVGSTFILLLLFLLNFTIFTDERTVSYESYIFESFDEDPLSRWIVRGSDYTMPGFPKTAKVKVWPQALHGKNREDKDYFSLGINGSFGRKGYNYIEIVPAREATNTDKESDYIKIDADGKKWVHNPLTLKGRARSLDIWVWSANYNYYLEVQFEDYLGIVHTLPLGELLFSGWKNLNTEIPLSIPQAGPYIPKIKSLKLVKFILWTTPTEMVSNFYFYLDQIKVLTDLFESRYDGDELEDPAVMEEIWSGKKE